MGIDSSAKRKVKRCSKVDVSRGKDGGEDVRDWRGLRVLEGLDLANLEMG